MSDSLRFVFLGLSITSSWGNGHATTYRSLVRGLRELGHDILFLERDVPWYASNRDDPESAGCRVGLYGSIPELREAFGLAVASADAVIVGSYVPEGDAVMRWVLDAASGVRLFYDIDTPVTLAQLERGEATYIDRETIAEVDAYLSFTGGPVLDYIEREMGAGLALPLYCGVDPHVYRPLETSPTRDLGYLGTYSADRQPTLDLLLTEPALRLPDRSFVVAGACYPDHPWPLNVARTEHVPPPDHPLFYNSLRFALNVTRADMVARGYSPSVRLFEAAACGVPVITDVWPGISQFFEPDREILVANSTERVLALLAELAEPDRRAIGQAARARVLCSHTARHRAEQLTAYVCELLEGKAPTVRAAAITAYGASGSTLAGVAEQ